MNNQLNLFDDLGFYEDSHVEYKSAKGGLPGDLWETYSAFANSDGGVIWLGIAQRNGELDIHGIADADKMRSDFWNLVSNTNKVSANLLSDSDVTVEEKNNKRVIRIRVPRAERRRRPVYVGQDPRIGTFRRNFEGDYRCTEEEVRKMFSDSAPDPADSRLLEHFGLEDLHAESLRRFRVIFATAKPGHPWASDDDKTLLSRLGGWRRDRAAGKEGLTVAGLLMFGKAEAIRDPEAIPGFQLDYREHFSDDPNVRWTDRLTLDGTWEGNLFEFYRQVILKLSVGPGIKVPFRRDEDGYRRTGTPIHEALQEALVNALVHADHSGQGGVVIDRYPDCIVFSNPGTLLLSREQLLLGGVSECRNKSLQLMFQLLGAGDKAGSGISKIRDSWAGQHWQSPSLGETHRPDRVKLVLPMVSTLPEPVLASLRLRFGEKFAALEADAVQALVLAEIEGKVTNSRLQGMLTRHRVDITDMLKDLVTQGFLAPAGVGRGAYYLPVAEASGHEDSAIKTGMSTDQTKEPPTPNQGTSDSKSGNLPANQGTSPDVVSKFADLAERVKKAGKSDPELMKAAVLEICRNDFISRSQLAELLGRQPAYIQERYLAPLLRQGLLTRLYPDTPNHPEQAYRTA